MHQQCFCRLVIHSWKFFLICFPSTVGGCICAFISVSLEHWWLSEGKPLCSSFDLILSIYITAAFMVRIFQSRNYVIVLLAMCICALSTGGSGLLPSPFHSLCDCSWNCISFFQIFNFRNNFVAKPSLRHYLRIMRLNGLSNTELETSQPFHNMFWSWNDVFELVGKCLYDA